MGPESLTSVIHAFLTFLSTLYIEDSQNNTIRNKKTKANVLPSKPSYTVFPVPFTASLFFFFHSVPQATMDAHTTLEIFFYSIP